MKCKFCGTVYSPNGDRFCESCGRELPQVTDAVDTSAADTQNNGPNTTVGKNSILSNSQINTTTTTNTTTVNNTTIEDDTKKSIVCAVSGKRVLYIESVCCRGCNQDVSLEFYNEKTRKCDNCHQNNLTQYKNAFKEAIQSGGGIDRHERAELDILVQNLQLTEKEKTTIENEIKNINALQSNNDIIGFGDLFEMELEIVKKDIFIKNDLSSALLRLKQLHDQVQTSEEISCLYFLLKAIKSPDMYLVNFEGAVYDDFWENYWLFVAHLNKADHIKGMKSIALNYQKFPERKSELALAEIVLLILRFQLEQLDTLIRIADQKFSMIENISGNLLTKLYKSNEKILASFDYGLMKFTNLSSPDEPGMKDYFNFFVNHLYKFVPETPKFNNSPSKNTIQNKNIEIPELPKVEQKVVESPILQTKHVSAPPKMPTLPTKPSISSNIENKPKLPPIVGKSNNSGPKLPPVPSISNQTDKKVNLPKIPPVPGKK